MAKCLGPAGSWACALPFGHEGDHERFAPEPQSTITAHQLELLAGVRSLRQERDELLLTCADLLAVVRQAKSVAMGRPHDGSQLDEDLEGLLLSARAAIKKAER